MYRSSFRWEHKVHLVTMTNRCSMHATFFLHRRYLTRSFPFLSNQWAIWEPHFSNCKLDSHRSRNSLKSVKTHVIITDVTHNEDKLTFLKSICLYMPFLQIILLTNSSGVYLVIVLWQTRPPMETAFTAVHRTRTNTNWIWLIMIGLRVWLTTQLMFWKMNRCTFYTAFEIFSAAMIFYREFRVVKTSNYIRHLL